MLRRKSIDKADKKAKAKALKGPDADLSKDDNPAAEYFYIGKITSW